jgi:Cu/Ag efflux protein CusF
MKEILILISLLLLAACQQNTPTTTNQTAKPPAAVPTVITADNTISANASPISSAKTFDKTKIKTFDGEGVITKINLELVSVELDHEEIKGLMPKMTMEFYVKEKSELERLKVGDKVDFVLEVDAGAEQIISIEKAK